MSKKPVNFYNHIRGAYTINLHATRVDNETVFSVDKKWKYIKQAIADKFLPLIVIGEDRDFQVLHFSGDVSEMDAREKLVFVNGEYIIYLTYVGDSELPDVEVVPIGSGDDGGDDGEDTGTRDSYIVFLSNDYDGIGILKYRDGETDVALLPSDIPADTGLISITYVEPDSETPLYIYYSLDSIELDATTLSAKELTFYNHDNGSIRFGYSSGAGGFQRALDH